MSKRNSVLVLKGMSLLIVASGIAFSIYSVMADVSFSVLSAAVPGYIFGLVAIFLGIRYFRSLAELKKKIGKPEARFSWGNFKRRQNV